MRTLITILTVAALLVAVAGPAQATDLFTAELQSGSAFGFFCCNVLNKSTTVGDDIIVSISIIAPSFPGTNTYSCTAATVNPQLIGGCCTAGSEFAGYAAYCKVTTTSAAKTRANIHLSGPYPTNASLSAAPAK